MLRIVDCLTLEHDLSLVVIAALLCLLGCVSCVLVSGRAMQGERTRLWLTLLGLSAGCTAWSTHFVAMLAYKTSVPITYDLPLTALSLVIGTLAMSLGFPIAYYGRHRSGLRLLGGVIVGGGVVALHYIGMAGLRFQGTMSFDTDLLVASLAAAIVFGALALDSLFNVVRSHAKVLAGVSLLLMIVTLHFLGMSATRLELSALSNQPAGLDRTFLITAVSIASLCVLLIGTIAAVFDQRVSNRLKIQAERFRMLADGAFEGLIVHQNLRIIDANVAGRKLLQIDGSELHRDLSEWCITEAPSLQIDGEQIVEELDIQCPDGSTFPAEICRRAIILQNGEPGELIAIRDLTQRKESEARITHLALHDSLTDLPNRRYFGELAQDAINRAARTGRTPALLLLDLDHFKAVNDMHGHAMGDELIQTVARLLTATLDDGDIVARLGGDEFTILSAGEDQPADAINTAHRIHEHFREGIVLNGARLEVNVSIGIALYPADGDSLEDLMRNADTAMYEAKADGKATTRFFESHMNVQLNARRLLEARLRMAVENGSLTLNYQPLICCTDQSAVCFEALLRWTDADLGVVSPAEFIPVAEQTGLILPIGEFVLRQACMDAATWPENIRVAVNLSVAQFGKQNIVAVVTDALQRAGLDGQRLELEITESLLIDNKDAAVRTLDELKALGVHIAMDDFGTGYSSLSYLQSFNFNKLKIDRAFITNLEHNPDAASIVEAVVSMGKSLHMRVVAEGVETREQASILTNLRCDELQGFLISRPMPAESIAGFLAQMTLGADSDDSFLSNAA